MTQAWWKLVRELTWAQVVWHMKEGRNLDVEAQLNAWPQEEHEHFSFVQEANKIAICK